MSVRRMWGASFISRVVLFATSSNTLFSPILPGDGVSRHALQWPTSPVSLPGSHLVLFHPGLKGSLRLTYVDTATAARVLVYDVGLLLE